jgi:broad specificity phosphatase PhoE
MRKVYLVRHANWNLNEDSLTKDGIEHARGKRNHFPEFARVYSSPLNRTQETAELLSGQKPQVDGRAATPKAPSEFGQKIAERRKTHPFGVAGALFDIPEVRPALQAAGSALSELIRQALSEVPDGQSALIVSHDGTMVSAERILKHQPFDAPLDHTYDELEGFIVDDNLNVRVLDK